MHNSNNNYTSKNLNKKELTLCEDLILNLKNEYEKAKQENFCLILKGKYEEISPLLETYLKKFFSSISISELEKTPIYFPDFSIKDCSKLMYLPKHIA